MTKSKVGVGREGRIFVLAPTPYPTHYPQGDTVWVPLTWSLSNYLASFEKPLKRCQSSVDFPFDPRPEMLVQVHDTPFLACEVYLWLWGIKERPLGVAQNTHVHAHACTHTDTLFLTISELNRKNIYWHYPMQHLVIWSCYLQHNSFKFTRRVIWVSGYFRFFVEFGRFEGHPRFSHWKMIPHIYHWTEDPDRWHGRLWPETRTLVQWICSFFFFFNE